MAAPSSKQSSDKEFLAEVSSLMLDGWKMLGITCPSPSCGNCTLLRDKQGVIQCVRCKKSFVTHQESTKFFAAPPHPAFEDDTESAMVGSGESTNKQRIDEATAKMGELMLQGWAMLAENCPNPACPGIPLMRKRGSTATVCLLCDPSGEISTQQTSESSTPTPAPAITASSSKPVSKPNVDSELQKKRDMVSSKMGAKLLSGWTMLSQNCSDPNCRGTPLMSKGNSTVKLCVCCDQEFGKKPEAVVKSISSNHTQDSSSLSSASKPPKSYSKLGEMFASTPSSSNYSPLPSSYGQGAAESKLQKASSCVSSKLLLGWTMLSSACDECGTPMMKHAVGSQGVPVCINTSCAAFHEKVSTTQNEGPHVKELDTMSDDEEFLGEEFERVVQSYKAKRFGQEETTTSTNGPSRNSQEEYGSTDKRVKRVSIDSARKQALEAVAHKLSNASEALMCSGSVSEDMQLAELITRLAAAAETLEGKA